jgi:hypothetical protein
MSRVAIRQAAFDALASPIGSVASAKNLNAKGELHVWLEPNVVNRLTALGGVGESFSDVILRLVEAGDACGL